MVLRTLPLLLAALVLAACGDDGDTAIDAQEGNQVRLGPVAYRVVSFRELNAATEADRSLVRSAAPAPRHGLFAAFIVACNRSEGPVTPSAAFRLQDAFSTNYAPLQDGLDRSLLYTQKRLEPGECTPQDGSVADRTFDGTALVFELPYDITQDRPLVLVVRTPDHGSARIQLDL